MGKEKGLGEGESEQKKSRCLQMGWRGGSLLISCLSSLQKISGKQRPWCLSFSQCVDEDALSGDMEMFGKLYEAAFYQYEDIVLKCI